MTLPQLFWLFICYSLRGWALEVSFEAVLHRRYVDKGVLNGPLCVVYGITGCIIGIPCI